MEARFDFQCSDTGPLRFSRPIEVIEARRVEDVVTAFGRAEAALAAGRWVAGWVAYEAAPAFDRALVTRQPGPVPLVRFGVYASAEPAAPLRGTAWPAGAPLVWRPAVSAKSHARAVADIRAAIARGDTYQINFTFPLTASLSGVSLPAWYEALASAARAPYSACLDSDDWVVVSLSPELFFHTDGGRLTTRPMKGTAPRGRFAGEDAARGDALRHSAKNRAENVMIVDLCRNDLTRVCQPGSVTTRSMFDVERYPTVWQMVSTVEGRLRPDATLLRMFEALFPAGSITGAPKSSSMRLIAALEAAPRGVYCGAIGYASPTGTARFNVAIRTATVQRSTGQATYGIGGGITWDSAAGDEHAEALQKAACLTPPPPVTLFETMREEQGVIVRRDAHLARMRESASYFDLPFDESAARAATEPACPPAVSRVRVQRLPTGAFRVERESLTAAPAPAPVVLATTAVDSRDVRLFHKTTRREVYDQHAAAHPDGWDVLLWNERGELTEFTRGNVVCEIDGIRVTPPQSCGLLGGVFRRHLLETGQVIEAVLTLDDLRRASRVWFVNSLREWVPVTVRP